MNEDDENGNAIIFDRGYAMVIHSKGKFGLLRDQISQFPRQRRCMQRLYIQCLCMQCLCMQRLYIQCLRMQYLCMHCLRVQYLRMQSAHAISARIVCTPFYS
jgi:hypothetical protein